MNLLEKEIRLKDLLEKNIREEKIGTAIAITGSWGVGKTYFWHKFRENYPFKNKYVYVSLFGLESLSDLKTHIYSNIENNHSAIEIPRWIRGLPSILKDTRISQFGLNASAKVFDSLMFNQVEDAIICFDDFERMSNKLDIKDVMGLANQLKVEKNCQVILILDETKTEDKNKEKYAEYKEKLIDETIKITSVEPLIRENAKDIDDQLVDLMVEFSDELEIHNFRFFQKVIKLYRQFLAQLPEQVASSTKEIILVRILQGYLISEFQKLEYTWSDSEYFTEKSRSDWSEIKKSTYDQLHKISYSFVKSDLWLNEFKKWFDQSGELDSSLLSELANSDLISENNNEIINELDCLMEQWRNLEIDVPFCQKLYDVSIKRIGLDNLDNLDFYCELLREFDVENLSVQLENKVKAWLYQEYMAKGNVFIEDQLSFGFKPENKLHAYLVKLREEMPYQGLPSLINVIHRYVVHSGWNSHTDSRVLEVATKEDWRKLIFDEIPNDERFKNINKLNVLREILNQQISVELQPTINNLIFDMLDEKASNSTIEKSKNIYYVIKRLKK